MWYDVYVLAEGSHVEVWWGEQGAGMLKVLESDSAGTNSATTFRLEANASSGQYDNVRMNVKRTTTYSFQDDFTDGDYTSNPAWTVESGTWSAASGYLKKTSAAQGSIKRSFSYKDYSVKFSYYCEDTSNNNYVLSPQLRYIDGTHYVYVKFYPNKAHIDLQNGSGTYQGVDNNNCTTVQDTWYDVTIKCDGKRIEVWRGLQGQDQTLVFSKTNGLLDTIFFKLTVGQDAQYRIDNVVFTAPDQVTTAFEYNDANELESMVENGVVETEFTYDDWGRTTGKTQGAYEAAYDWRYGDKLKYVTSDFPGEAATVSYIYDGLGKRRTKYVNGSDWTHYRWDRGWNMIAEYDHGASEWDIGNLANTFIPGLAEVPGTTPATGSYRYYQTDHLGTVKGILSQSQATLASYIYEPFGYPLVQAGLPLNKGFTGHTWEPEIRQYYSPFRYYGPMTGRWLSRDPLGMIDGPNVYAYVNSNVIKSRDQSGCSSVVDGVNLIGCITGAAGVIDWRKFQEIISCLMPDPCNSPNDNCATGCACLAGICNGFVEYHACYRACIPPAPDPDPPVGYWDNLGCHGEHGYPYSQNRLGDVILLVCMLGILALYASVLVPRKRRWFVVGGLSDMKTFSYARINLFLFIFLLLASVACNCSSESGQSKGSPAVQLGLEIIYIAERPISPELREKSLEAAEQLREEIGQEGFVDSRSKRNRVGLTYAMYEIAGEWQTAVTFLEGVLAQAEEGTDTYYIAEKLLPVARTNAEGNRIQ